MTQISQARKNRENSFGFLIQLIGRKFDADMKARLAEVGIDIKIFANLMILLEKDGVNQKELGDKLNFPDYYTSRNIDALVKAGFAERRPDPNSRRSILIYLTELGRQKAAELPQIIYESNKYRLSRLNEEEQKQVVKLLQKSLGIDHEKEEAGGA